MFSCNKKEDFQEQVANDCIGEYTSEEIEDTLVSAFFGLDNALPSLLGTNKGATGRPVPLLMQFLANRVQSNG